jgi:hypothetical protein
MLHAQQSEVRNDCAILIGHSDFRREGRVGPETWIEVAHPG